MHLHATLARCVRVFLLPPTLLALTLAATPAWAKPVRGQTGATQIGAVCHNNSNSVQQLAEISNTRDGNVQCLGVTVDGNAIKSLRVESHRFDTARADHVKIAEFSVAQIESRHGAVLDGAPGHDAVIIQGRVSDADGNADLVTRYLYNGLTGEYRSCRIKIDREADTTLPAWRLVNQFNETVSRIVVRTHSIPVLGTIGIANLEGACTPI